MVVIVVMVWCGGVTVRSRILKNSNNPNLTSGEQATRDQTGMFEEKQSQQ